jgi:hypothetical protein
MNQTMYAQNVYFPDVFKGCKHDCIYCKHSFQRQAKRQKQRCIKCYSFEPHSHLERLRHPSPKTVGNKFVFFPKGGDVVFCHAANFLEMLKYAESNPQTTFLIQTKDPRYFNSFRFPKNVILGITLESDMSAYDTPSKYHYYHEISLAPAPLQRLIYFLAVPHVRKEVTIEPILQCSDRFADAIIKLKPEFVYVGYDTKGCHLPEPSLKETQALIDTLGASIPVRLKTIRKAWYEGTLNDS